MPADQRQRNPRGQGALLREPLVAAAIELITEKGDLSQVSVRAITRRAGVSPTALYLHFPDREAILDAAIDAGFAAFNQMVGEAAEGADAPRERVLAMGSAYIRFAQQQPALYAVIFTARRELTDDHPREEARKAGFVRLAEEVARAGAGDPEEVAAALWAALHGYVLLCALGMNVSLPTAERFLRRLLDAHLP